MKKIESPSAPVASAARDPEAEPVRTADSESPAVKAVESPAVADGAALNFFGAATRGLLPEEADAWASLVGAAEVKQAIVEKRDMIVVDVRAEEDYAKGHVPGAVSLPRAKWPSAAGLSKEKVNVVYCYSHTCPLGGEACAKLAGEGYPVVEMDGGFEIWQASQLEVEQ